MLAFGDGWERRIAKCKASLDNLARLASKAKVGGLRTQAGVQTLSSTYEALGSVSSTTR